MPYLMPAVTPRARGTQISDKIRTGSERMEGIYVPEEILRKILLKLPFKSLVASSCVSKTWRALILNLILNEDLFNNKSNNKNSMVFLMRQFGGFNYGSGKRFDKLLPTQDSDCDQGKYSRGADVAYFFGDFGADGRRLLEETLRGSLAPAGGVFLNGSCYWLGLETSLILAFDFRTKSFGLIKCPNARIGFVSPTSTLSVSGNSLALITQGMRGLFEIWVMIVQQDEDGNDSFYWFKRKSVRCPLYFPTILTCWNDNWLLLRSRCGTRITSCFLGDGNDSTSYEDWGV
ncbi:OLC1v1009843C1 [Oldenlandia corymbosa var. corymbosa]|uniref:OLC1v1009843C1 n=1 Tax=Oldenlandia corymbosa var. corymbosa TaxID=529605 RepID=A0AAV1DSI4_OLDCO|nr:OLC1v1009843C1 [Oldenlandia corymbosa var. corymbosa]